uniref:Uncharacterized protein n=1 Tax=Ceratitis capitata TaxID=7213 RepID=W8BDS7_CERCA
MFNSNSASFLKPSNPSTVQQRVGVTSAMSDFDAKISVDAPLKDYEKLIEEKVQSEGLDEEEIEKNYKIISAAARDTVWKLLFSSSPITKESLENVAEFLNKIKEDASFYDPYTYNEWISGLRDELLKRNMLDFWRDHVVVKELGPCWARDSDYFDDMEDPAPAQFYNHAGCVAPFAPVTGRRLNSDILDLPTTTNEERLDS